jgi:exopolysaccharide biosynthesis polyprenyl glycosylphosphotransferase
MNTAATNNRQEHTSRKIHSINRSLFFDRTVKNTGFYLEDEFIEMLSRETQRCKRTKMPILLMIINIKKIAQLRNPREKTRSIASLLALNTRETDIKGWYRDNSAIGVIFVGIKEKNIRTAKDIIARELKHKLKMELSKEVLDMLTISYHIFPERIHADNPDRFLERTFYQDLEKSSVSRFVGRFLKRCVDITGSIVGLVLFSPLFLIISILIKLNSDGPVFFKQTRIGLFGKTFTFLKFRSMYVNNDDRIHREYIAKLIDGKVGKELNKDGDAMVPVFKIKADPRITPIGRFLRKSSLDELPQFLNVLKGEMSLVGPRPPVPYEFEQYDIWHRERLVRMKPGITGLWQVMGRSSTSFDDMVRLDVKYIREWSLWRDIVILCKTPWVVLTGKGAY